MTGWTSFSLPTAHVELFRAFLIGRGGKVLGVEK